MKPPESRVLSSLNWLPSSVFAVFSADGLPWKVAAYTHQGPGGQAGRKPGFPRPRPLGSRNYVYDINTPPHCGNPSNRIVVRRRHPLESDL